MQSATSIVDQAITKMELEEQGVISTDDDKKPVEGADNAEDTDKKEDPAKDDKADGEAAGKDDKSGAGADKKPEGEEDEEDKEGEFTADDALEVEDKTPADDKKPEAPTDNAGIRLSPDESKYIADNIGEPLVLKGMVGDKEVEIKAYSPADIPANFSFANDAQMIAAQNGFQSLERKAEQLLGNFRQNQSDAQAKDFERRENEGIRADVADLQKEGRFPKFKVQPGAEGFDDSAEAKLMADVLKIMTEKNDMYFKQYQQGRPYKHIGFSEAFAEFERTNPERLAAKKVEKEQEEEDKARKGVADKVGTGGGEPAYNIQKPTIKSGTTISDILNRIDMEE